MKIPAAAIAAMFAGGILLGQSAFILNPAWKNTRACEVRFSRRVVQGGPLLRQTLPQG